MGLIASFLMPILMGVPLVLLSPFDWVRAPHKLFKAISEYSGTLTWLPNFAYNFCAKKIREEDLNGLDLSSMRAVINCSEPMKVESHVMFAERFSKYGLNELSLATCYAMAENVFAVTQDGIDEPVMIDIIDRDVFQNEGIAKKITKVETSLNMVSAGKPVANCSVKIIDEKGKVLPERHLGEIIIKSDCMLEEYYLRKIETKASMLNGWFKTGDLGYFAEGKLFISGRKKDLIIIGGKNIYPQDIESVVNEVKGVHPGRTVAFGVFNDSKGTEEAVVLAELDSGHVDNREAIADEIRKNVNQSTAIALRHVFLVDDKWLIKTSSGKIARAANKAKYLDSK
jgi:acyl-CoA synthetase (AMP-forming)/AMP-acid ligase II